MLIYLILYNINILSSLSFYLTIPEKPIKANARIPAIIIAIGEPANTLGTSRVSNASRIPANKIKATPKPNAEANENTTVKIKLKLD